MRVLLAARAPGSEVLCLRLYFSLWLFRILIHLSCYLRVSKADSQALSLKHCFKGQLPVSQSSATLTFTVVES